VRLPALLDARLGAVLAAQVAVGVGVVALVGERRPDPGHHSVRQPEQAPGCGTACKSFQIPGAKSLLHNRLWERRDDVFWYVSVLTARLKHDSIAASTTRAE
jgi:hypothetical protein